MHQRNVDFAELPSSGSAGRDAGGFNPRLALLTFAFGTFIMGGFAFGWLFLANWRILVQFQATQVQIPGGPTISVPDVPSLGVVQPPARPGRPDPRPAVVAAPQPTETPREPDLPEWTGHERVNILLLGIDHREDEPIDGSRSDTIMVVSIDPTTRSAVMVSFPRDLWVSIPGHFNQRINVAHANGGPSLVARTIEANFGLRIRHFARVDFRGFEQIVDALDGIIVDVERPIKDDEYPTEDYGLMRLFIPPGPQLMDGRTALMYARSRHSENDFGRARRQQRVLMAIRDRGLQLNVLPKLPTMIGLAQKTVQTDIGVRDMLALARLGSTIDRENITSLVVDATYADPFIGPSGEEVLSPRRADIQRAINRAFAEAAGESATLEVLNGTTRPGLAGRLADRLAAAGYSVLRVADADSNDYPSTTIQVLTGNQKAAERLAARLRLPPEAIQIGPPSPTGAELRVIVGQNYQG